MRYNTLFSGANQITNKARKVYSYKLSTNEQDAEGPVASLLTPTLLSDAFSRLQKALPEAVTGLSMTSLSNAPYADYRGTYTDRQQTAETMASVLESAEKTRGVYAENPAYYALPYLQVAAGLPSDSSRYDIFDESVPFLQLTLRGLMTVSTRPINLAGDGERLFLKAVETGSSLKFAFIGCDFRSCGIRRWKGCTEHPSSCGKIPPLRISSAWKRLWKGWKRRGSCPIAH